MKKRGLFLLAVAIIFILALYAAYVYPIPGTDSIVYIPTALLYAKGEGLINPLYYVSELTDPTGGHRYNYYVPLQSMLLGALSRIKPDVRTIFMWCWAINAGAMLLYVSRVSKWVQNAKPGVRVAAYLSLIYVAMYLLPTAGRPECLTIPLIMLLYLLYHKRQNVSPMTYSIGIAVLGGLMLCTQILSCFFAFLFLVTYELLETKNVWRTIGVNFLRFVGILVVCGGAMALSPNGLVNTIEGITTHALYAMGRVDRSLPLFVYYWVLSPINFAFAVLFGIGAFYHIRTLIVRLRTAAPIPKAFVVLTQVIIVGGIVKYIFYASPTVYNATQFILPLSAYVIYNLASGQGGKIAVASMLATYAAGGLMFMRSLALFVDYVQDGKTFNNARKEVNNILQQYPGAYISQGIWGLIEDPHQTKIYVPGAAKSGDVVIVQQAYHPFRPELEGKVTILMDWRTTDQRRVLGIPLTKRPQGYSFVVCKVN